MSHACLILFLIIRMISPTDPSTSISVQVRGGVKNFTSKRRKRARNFRHPHKFHFFELWPAGLRSGRTDPAMAALTGFGQARHAGSGDGISNGVANCANTKVVNCVGAGMNLLKL